MEDGLGQNTAGKEVTAIVKVQVKSVKLIKVSVAHGAEHDGVAFEHNDLLS
jgi:hypothetical protein